LISKREFDENSKKSSADQLANVDTSTAAAGGTEGVDIDVGDMMKKCAELSVANSLDEGWVNLLTNDWMRIDKKPVEDSKRKSKSEIYMRGVWTMNLSFVECCDMMFTFDGARRHKWDPNFAKIDFPNGGSSMDDDVVTSATINMGFLINLAMFGTSGPGTLDSRNYRWLNHPVQGAVTYAMVPWNVKENKVDANNKLMTIKVGTIAPHPTMADKCIMTTLETNKFGGIPNWAMHFLTSVTAPSLMRGLESRYIANIRNKNEVMDLTKTSVTVYSNNADESKSGESKYGHK